MKNLLTFIFAGAAIVALGVGFTACDQPEILAETGIDEPEVIGIVPVFTTDGIPKGDEPVATGTPPVSTTDIPEIAAFFEQHLPISDYSSSPHKFNFGDVDPSWDTKVCLMINSMDEFRAVAPPSAELPEIDFEKYTLVIGQNPMGDPGYRLKEQGLETESDVMALNLVYRSLGGFTPATITTFYYWGLYPKLPKKSVTVNVVISHYPEYYYWCGDEKIPLTLNKNKVYILIETSKHESFVKAVVAAGGIAGPSRVMENYAPLGIASSSEKFKLPTSLTSFTLENINFDAIDTTELVYIAPYFKMSDGYDIGITNIFSVRVKGKQDLALLKQIAEKNRLALLGNGQFDTSIYRLACTKASNGNALEMSNFLYESGAFEFATPEFLINSFGEDDE